MDNTSSAKSVYQQSDKLEERLLLLPFMESKERNIFVEELRSLIAAARQSKLNTKSDSTKNRLQIIIEAWEELLGNISSTSTSKLTILSQSDKTSQSPTKIRAEESSIKEFGRAMQSHLPSQILSPSKVDANSRSSIPHDPVLRAIFDELYGIIDS